MYKRLIPLQELVQRKSLFLLGPRQTGKTTLIQSLFPEAHFVNLLEAETFRQLSAHPEYLRQTLPDRQRLLIIDEIQRLPNLLNEVQLLIDRNPRLRALLTGSSARKLKKGIANLLGGRAWTSALHPFVSKELGKERLMDRLNRGSLPSVIDAPYPAEELKAYVGTYLQEEIQAEGLTRSIENFSRFLEVAGMTSGQQLNFTAVANDAQVPARTVREHYQVLADTLLGHLLPPYQKTRRRKPVATSKFYLMDVGVANTLKRVGQVEKGSAAFGEALEHLVFLELLSFRDYFRRDELLTYWRSQSQLEVDFVWGDSIAIEVKAKSHVSDRDLKGLAALSEEVSLKKQWVVSLEPRRRKVGAVEILPVDEFFDEVWGNHLNGGKSC